MVYIDQIEIQGSVFTGPAPGNYHRADFDRPKESINFCLLEPVKVHYYYSEGVNLSAIAKIAAGIVGAGFYGIAGYNVIKSEA